MKQIGVRQIAKQRIAVLFEQARKVARADPELAGQYVATARRIAMAARVGLPVGFRRQTCKACNCLFVYGVNCRVRVKQKREPHVVVTCLNCGSQTRILLKEKKGAKKVEQDYDSDEASC
jgi:ribonuclease P protein subunit RPR2